MSPPNDTSIIEHMFDKTKGFAAEKLSLLTSVYRRFSADRPFRKS